MAISLPRAAKTQTQRVPLTLLRITLTIVGLSFLVTAFSLYLFDVTALSRVQLLFVAVTLPAVITPFVSWQHAKRAALVEDLQEEVKLASRHDDATGVLSRRFFYENAHRELQLASRHGHPMSLAILRISNSNKIYKQFGRVMGSHAFRSSANQLKNALRETDILARFSEDSFIVLMPHSNAQQAQEAAERLEKSLSESPITFKNDSIKLNIKTGLGSSIENYDLNTLVSMAEKQLDASTVHEASKQTATKAN